MPRDIAIVNRGRGPQLSTSRITVQDLVPHFQRKRTYEEILEIIPLLTVEEIQAVERYIHENFDAVMEQDHRIRERNAARKEPPEVQEILWCGGLRLAALREEFRKKKEQEKNASFHDRRSR